MRPKRLISLLVAVCMMITMLPLSAVTAFAEDTSTVRTANDGTYKYEYKVSGGNATITKFCGPLDPVDSDGNVANPDLYYINIPSELNGHPVTGLGAYSFTGEPFSSDLYKFNRKIRSVTIPEGVTSIGGHAFEECFDLENVTIPQSVTSIGSVAFLGCHKIKTLSLGENIETIGGGAFFRCSSLSNITIPKKVKVIESGYSGTPSFYGTFQYCSSLKYIILPAGLEYFNARLDDCPECVIYYNNARAKAGELLKNNYRLNYAVQNGHQLLCLCHVTFDANGGKLTGNLTNYLTDNLTDHAEVPVYETEKITETLANDLKATDLDAINHPTRTGYNFIGWYTTADGKPEDGNLFHVDNNTAITKDITLYARWEFDPTALDCHKLTVTGGTVTVKYDGSDVTSKLNSSTDATTGQKTYSVPDGATVTVTLDKTLIPEGMVFDIWSTGKFSLPLGQDYKAENITFTMSSDVDIAAQYRDATIEDDGPGVLGTVAIIGTAAVGGAVLGYQAYSLGAEFAGKLMALPYFPSNRSALAMMLWEDAGKPMPESELLYPDVGQEEQDMDLQHAARWAMENELIPDLNDEGTAPEEMKFFPANPVSKLDVLNAWQKAQELKNN